MIMNNDVNKIAETLKAQLKTLEAVNNKAFAGLSVEAQQKVKGPQMDFSKAIRAIESGDIEALYKLAK